MPNSVGFERTRRQRRVLGLCLVGALVMGGCKDPVSPQAAALDSAEARWRAGKVSTSYRMQQRVACFCPWGNSMYDVFVTNGVITSALSVEASTPAPPSLLAQMRTVEQLFAEVHRTLELPGVLTSVTYDPTLGFPTLVSLDPIRAAIDDEVSYLTQRVVMLSPP
jgi:hypothetical protein